MKHRRAQRERTDPKSDFFVPNSWENRRGEDPHALRSTGPPYETHAATTEAPIYRLYARARPSDRPRAHRY